MKRWILNGMGGVLLIGLGGCVAAVITPGRLNCSACQGDAATATVRRGAVSGVAQRVSFSYSVDPDCTSAGLARLSVKVPPAHGSVVFRAVDDYPNFPVNNPRSACNRQKVRGVGVFYTSVAGYTGEDHMVVERVAVRGALSTTDYRITVIEPAVQTQSPTAN